MGISGANFMVAETGTIVLVTNEGNGRMCTTLPPVHVAIAGIDKVVPDMESLSGAVEAAGAQRDRAEDFDLHVVHSPARAAAPPKTARRNFTWFCSTMAARVSCRTKSPARRCCASAAARA